MRGEADLCCLCLLAFEKSFLLLGTGRLFPAISLLFGLNVKRIEQWVFPLCNGNCIDMLYVWAVMYAFYN